MKKAIDIVLLPPHEITQEAIKLNASLPSPFPEEKTRLNNKTCLPHISLFMGVVEESNIKRAQIILNKIAKQLLPIQLEIDKVIVGNDPESFIASTLQVKLTGDLKKLHRIIIDAFSELVSSDGTIENVFDYENAVPETILYINSFLKNSSFENFNPHISIGFGDIAFETPRQFTASEIAICHLGNFCTCREVLAKSSS